MQEHEHKLLDRAAMIEAASRSLRQQMRARDRPRSRGSIANREAVAGAVSEAPQETSQRRIHSAENKFRMVSHRDGVENNHSASSGALESYQAEEEPGDAVTNSPFGVSSPTGAAHDDIPPLGELKRPMSRKKVPSASAAAGLGACAFSQSKMTDAFEQRKTRQPIPIESWGPRPPSRTSRHRLPPNTLLDMSLLATPGDEDRGESKLNAATGASRSRSEPGRESSSGRPSSRAGTESVTSSTKWAAARCPVSLGGQHHSALGLNDPRRGRKAGGSPQDLGVFGVSGTRSPNGQQLSKSLSGVFDQRQAAVRLDGGSWAAHVDTAGALEVSGSALGDQNNLWLGTPPLGMRKSRHPEAVSVEDVEADQDVFGSRTALRRDSSPQVAQVIVTRSSAQKKDRGEVRRVRDDRLARGRQRNDSTPFKTSLDVDFLSLFAM